MLMEKVHEAIANLWGFKKTLDYLGVNYRTLQRYVAEEQIPSVLIGRARMFNPDDVMEFKKVVNARKRAIMPKK